MSELDRLRRDAARKFMEDAASMDDPQDALIMEMGADDLTRELSPVERELLDAMLAFPDDPFAP